MSDSLDPADASDAPIEEPPPDIYSFLDDSLEVQFPTSPASQLIHPQIIFQTNSNNSQLQTNLFIAFGRNWFMLQQCVVSYIAAGWPANNITVFDNLGVMAANLRGQLNADNPAYVDVKRLTDLGVSYERIPTLLTFYNYKTSTSVLPCLAD